MLGIVECGFQKWISELLYNQNKAIKSFFFGIVQQVCKNKSFIV